MPKKKTKPEIQSVHICEEWQGEYGSWINWEGVVKLDQRIINAVNQDWKKHFYNLVTVEQIASHIAYNFIVNGVCRVNQLDGFADQPDDIVFELEAD